MCSSTLPSTSALDEGGWSTPLPGCFTPRKTRYPLYRGLEGPQSRSGWVRKISPPQGFDPRTVQPVASRYTDKTKAGNFFYVYHMIKYEMSGKILVFCPEAWTFLSEESSHSCNKQTVQIIFLFTCTNLAFFTIPSSCYHTLTLGDITGKTQPLRERFCKLHNINNLTEID